MIPPFCPPGSQSSTCNAIKFRGDGCDEIRRRAGKSMGVMHERRVESWADRQASCAENVFQVKDWGYI